MKLLTVKLHPCSSFFLSLDPDTFLSIFSNTLSICPTLKMRENVSHTHTCKKKRQNYVSIGFSFKLFDFKKKTEDSASSDSKHSLTSVCSYFLHSCNFDVFSALLLCFNYDITKSIYYLFSCCDTVLYSVYEAWPYT